MSQRGSIPDMNAPDGSFLVQHMSSGSIALLGSCERHDQIELRAGIDHPADAAQNSIHFAKCSEAIDVDRRKARGLREQFFVCHDWTPHWSKVNHDTGMSDVRSQFNNLTTNSIPHRVVSEFETIGVSA